MPPQNRPSEEVLGTNAAENAENETNGQNVTENGKETEEAAKSAEAVKAQDEDDEEDAELRNLASRLTNGALANNFSGSKAKMEQFQLENEANLVVPPDGGWGWVIVAASFFCNMVVDGIIFSFGLLMVHMYEPFDATKSQMALVGSLLSGFYLMAGPFVSAVANKFGFRTVAIMGSFIGAGAFLLAYFAESFEFLCFTYGILGGIGFGLIYMPAVIAVGFYFEKWRALATGISVCGSGIGTFLFAPLFGTLLETIGWRNTILAQVGIILTCALAGLLFRPLNPITVVVTEADGDNATGDKNTIIISKANSLVSIAENDSMETLKANNNTKELTVISAMSTKSLDAIGTRLNVPNATDVHDDGDAPLLKRGTAAAKPIVIDNRRSEKTRSRTGSECGSTYNRSRRGTVASVEFAARPLDRADAFFGGSLARLPQYTSQSSLAYHLSVTKSQARPADQQKPHPTGIQTMLRTLTKMLDFSLLKSPSFLLLALSGGFTMMGFFVPFMYVTDRAILGGIDKDTAMWLVSAIGICNTIGRVVCGIISSVPKVNVLLVNNVAISICGLSTLFSALSMSAEYQFFYALVFGLSVSCFASLRSILVVELVGLEKLTNAFGLLLLFQGIAATIGAPMAGMFMEATGSYDYSFYLSGFLIFVSAVMCYPLMYIKRWELNKDKKTKQQQLTTLP